MRKLVVDVGANIGTFSRHVLRVAPDYIVFAVEPNQNFCLTELTEIMKIYSQRFSFFLVALGRQTGIENFYASKVMESQLASLLPLNPSAAWPEAVQQRLFSIEDLHENPAQIEVQAVSEFIQGNEIQTIDFLKIDTQGTDLDILDEFLFHSDVKVAVVEIEIDSNNPNSHYLQNLDQFAELNKIIEKYGYKVFKVTPNGPDTQEYNFFLGKSREEFWEICHELKISESPIFGGYWEILGVGKRLNENFESKNKALALKAIKALGHPVRSWQSVTHKLTR